jgi:1-acyl-sn-glycerol-3-phosphate acyltransferase
MSKIFIIIRSIIFYVLMIIALIIISCLGLLTFPFNIKIRYKVITSYSRVVIWLAKVICGIKYEVSGLENLPKEAAIVFSNHQSTWETLAFQIIFPYQTWVVKKQLLQIPFFGWAFALLNPIAIDRKQISSAMEQILTEGKKQLAEGRWVIIFPEGTRVAIGTKTKYARGGAILAETTKRPVVPVAHNAGKFWSRQAFLKKPGIIKVVIGPTIDSNNKDFLSINRQARQWIQSTQEKL